MIPEREREALMRLTMCAREECGMCKYKDTCDFDFQYETATRCMNILAEALRKTEPQTCEECKHWSDTEDGCADRHGCKTTEDCSTVPTSSKMEQVQPQTCSVNGRPYTECCNCEYFKCTADEPKTERSGE